MDEHFFRECIDYGLIRSITSPKNLPPLNKLKKRHRGVPYDFHKDQAGESDSSDSIDSDSEIIKPRVKKVKVTSKEEKHPTESPDFMEIAPINRISFENNDSRLKAGRGTRDQVDRFVFSFGYLNSC